MVTASKKIIMPLKKTPFILTIFGASGDLAKIKLFPALYEMFARGKIHREFYIIGFARTPMERAAFQKEFAASVKKYAKFKVSTEKLNELLKHVHYFHGEYDRAEDYARFAEFLRGTVKKSLLHLFYFSVPPVVFRPIIQCLGESKLNTPRRKERLIIEKPFGESAESAKELFHFVARYFKEDQVFLLDHYLGKSAVQSILHLRHSNRILNYMLKGQEISNIQITAFEKVGVEDRIGYFEHVGMIKDMIQSHLLQVLALTTMSIPVTERAVSVQKEKINMLSSLNFVPSARNIVLGQYKSYRKLKGVAKDSHTETFAAVRLLVDRESWFSVPIYLRTGKMLNEKRTYIVAELKKFPFQKANEPPNRVIIELQPNEHLSIKLLNKHGNGKFSQDLATGASIACDDGKCLSEYATLLLDVVVGNKTYFLTFLEIIAAWSVVDAMFATIHEKKVPLHHYVDGSQGPTPQNELTALDGFAWYHPHDGR